MQREKKGIYETNLSTGHADALHMRWNLILALYLEGQE
jgi:hypothetical protein